MASSAFCNANDSDVTVPHNLNIGWAKYFFLPRNDMEEDTCSSQGLMTHIKHLLIVLYLLK